MRVRGYYELDGDRAYSEWATGSASTDISNPPGVPTNVSARLEVTGSVFNIRTDAIVSWSSVPVAEEYEVQYALDNIFDPTAPLNWSQSTTTSNTNLTIDLGTAVGGGATIRVRSKAIDNRGNSLYSSWVETEA